MLDVDKVRRERKRLQQSTSVADQCTGKIRSKLGDVKGRFYGCLEEVEEGEDDEDSVGGVEGCVCSSLEPRLGALTPEEQDDNDAVMVVNDNEGPSRAPTQAPAQAQGGLCTNPDLFKDDSPGVEQSDEDLVDLVARRLEEKRCLKQEQEEEERKRQAKQRQEQLMKSNTTTTTTSSSKVEMTRTGVGGAWQ